MANEVEVVVRSKDQTDFSKAEQGARNYGDSLDGVGDKADVAEQRVMGARDMIDGASAVMAGPGAAGISAYLQGWADMASGVVNFVVPAFKAIITGGLQAAASATANAARHVAAWVVMSAQATLHAARIAAAWLISIGPIALVIAAIVGLVVLIVKNWDTISNATRALVSYLVGKWNDLIGWLKGVPGRVGSALSGLWNRIGDGLQTQYDRVRDLGGRFVNWASGLPSRMWSAVSGMFNGIPSAFRTAINSVISKWNGLSFRLGGGSYDPLGDYGPTIHVPSFTINTPNIPYLARGGIAGGLAMVGERGRELVRLPHGSSVIPNGTTEGMLAGSGREPIVIELRSSGSAVDNFLLELLRKAIRVRGGDVQIVLGAS